MPQTYDIVAIGDVVVDAFIKLSVGEVTTDPETKEMTLSMPFGDKIPYESLKVVAAVGNASNVAVGLARLGFKPAMLAAIGKDYYGQQIMDHYGKEGVATELVKVNDDLPTNYHFVLNYGAERTILVKHEDFSYAPITAIGDAPWIYFSSIGQHALALHDELAAHLDAHPNIKLGFNPGTFQIKLGAERLQKIYAHTYVLFVNREEAAHILGTHERDIKTLFAGLHKLGPKIVAITDGPAAAYASDGSKAWQVAPYPDPKPPISRTGAGDAFATGFMAALMSGLGAQEALRWGPIESMSVVQAIGAQTNLLTKPQLTSYLESAPASYKVSPLE
jgi:sugar/nucleoside kinase (ribokinase family)